jgi:c-di-GMP-related signal transduction protein
LQTKLETIVEGLPLADELIAALVQRSGAAGAILDAVICYEKGHFDADALRPYGGDIAKAYLEALEWSQQTLATIAPEPATGQARAA